MFFRFLFINRNLQINVSRNHFTVIEGKTASLGAQCTWLNCIGSKNTQNKYTTEIHKKYCKL